jgi:hypothetical protein
MKIPVLCGECGAKNVDPLPTTVFVGFRDDGRYEITCPKGHTLVTVLQQEKFEILFEIGANAIIDGYFREAVTSFSASLERFYEFLVRVSLFEAGRERGDVHELWASIGQQSERQLGAFIMSYIRDFGRAPSLLSNPRVKFRNEVVHAGRIPNREEAVAFGDAVLDVIRPKIREARTRYEKGLRDALFAHIAAARLEEDEGRRVSTAWRATILSISDHTPGHDERSLEAALGEIVRWSTV